MIKGHLYRLKRNLPYFLDQLVSPFIDPRDGVVITGFWRSGTTWLEHWAAEILHAKTIFEPLEVDVRHAYRLDDDAQLPSLTDQYLKAHMPYAEDVIPRTTRFYHLLEDALRGKVPGKRVRINRNGPADSFRRRVVVKHVRGQLAVYGIYKTFSTPVLHIRRDPRAIVASIVRKDWGGEWLHQLSLYAQLLQPQDGRCAHFEKWSDEIRYYDRQPWWERVVAYWALTENYLRSCSDRHQFPICSLSYEELTLGDPSILLSGLRQIGINVPMNSSLARERMESSATTDKDRRDANPESRVFGWKNELSTQMADRTLKIVEQFGITINQYQ